MGKITTFSLKVIMLSSYIIAMRLQYLLHKTIKLYITGVGFYYVELSISKKNLKIFHTPLFKRVITSIKCFNEKPNVKEQYFIIQLVLRITLIKLNKNI